MAIGISSALLPNKQIANVDARYLNEEAHPYASVSAATTALGAKVSENYIGLKVLVKESGWTKAKEYWVQPDGNSGYALEEVNTGGGSTPADPHETVSGATPSVTVAGGKYYTFDSELDSLTLAIGTDNPYVESNLEFTTSASWTGITWPSGAKFANQQPVLVAESSYLVTVLHGIIAVTEVVAS